MISQECKKNKMFQPKISRETNEDRAKETNMQSCMAKAIDSKGISQKIKQSR